MQMDPIAAAKDGELLLERDAELELLRDALERLCDGHGSAVLIDGSAGIGKTSLLAAATDLASEAPVQLRAARAGRLEREMPFVVARQLLEPVIERSSEDERSRLLEGAAALALVALGGAGSGEGAVGDPFAPIHGLYWLLANLAESEPVVLVVDDVHWVDGRSLRWLDFVARRASDTGVLLLAAARTGEAEEPPELEALRADARSVLHPSPLSRAAVEQLIAAAFDAELPAGLSDACSTATGGNPFLLAELLRGLRSSNTTDAVRTIAESATSLTTDTLARSVQSRIEPFGGDAIELARAIAVLRGAPQLRHVAKLACLSEDRVSELADRLRVAEILSPGHPIDFVHPLVRSSVYEGLSEVARSRAHRRAA
jgi:predicted ATPase